MHLVKVQNFLGWLQNEQNKAQNFKSKVYHFILMLKPLNLRNATSVNSVIILPVCCIVAVPLLAFFILSRRSYTKNNFFLSRLNLKGNRTLCFLFWNERDNSIVIGTERNLLCSCFYKHTYIRHAFLNQSHISYYQ